MQNELKEHGTHTCTKGDQKVLQFSMVD